MRYVRIAFNLLTTLPVVSPADWRPGDSGRAAGWFPLVGLAIGLLVATAYIALQQVLPLSISAALVLSLWAALTGGLHLDGLADCCDGLLHASSPERRLEIMRDPQLGAFGVVGLVLALLLKWAALAALAPERTLLAILLAASLARWIILLAARQPLARPTGMAADVAVGLSPIALVWGAIVPAGLALALGWDGLLAVALALMVAIGLLRFARRRIGGVTGDVFGLLVETSEIVVLIALTL